MWYLDVTKYMKENAVYTRKQVCDFILKKKPGLSNNSLKWIISDMVKNGAIFNIQRGMYSLTNDNDNTFEKYVPTVNNELILLCEKIKTRFPLIEYVCFESIQLNEFLNHLIAKNTYYIYVEKDASSAVFRYLQEEGIYNILYKPTTKEFDSYWKEKSIIILDLISEYPKNKYDSHIMSIEQLLVDIISEKSLTYLYSKSEIVNIYKSVNKKYKIDYSKLYRYARRRNKEEETKEIMKEAINANR